MAPPVPPDADDEDAAARYLKRMQGAENAPPATQIRDARSGRLIPSQGSTPATSPSGLPEMQGPILSRGTPPPVAPRDTSLPPGAPRNIMASPAAGAPPTAQPGSLPPQFMSRGVEMLRATKYQDAAAYYEAIARQQPDKAEGWLGLGAAMFGAGDLKKGSTYLAKGSELDDGFPVGALVVEALPGKPEALFNLANSFMAIQKGPGYHCAMLTLDEVMASPMTPEKLYLKADILRRKAREALEWWEARDNPAMMNMRRNAARQRMLSSLIRMGFMLVVIGGLAIGAWIFMQKGKVEALVRLGTDEYAEGYRMENFGQGKRATSSGASNPRELYQRAYEKFREAASVEPKDFDANYMLLETANILLKWSATGQLTPDQIKRMQGDVKRAKEVLKLSDPTGQKSLKKGAELKQRLESP